MKWKASLARAAVARQDPRRAGDVQQRLFDDCSLQIRPALITKQSRLERRGPVVGTAVGFHQRRQPVGAIDGQDHVLSHGAKW